MEDAFAVDCDTTLSGPSVVSFDTSRDADSRVLHSDCAVELTKFIVL